MLVLFKITRRREEREEKILIYLNTSRSSRLRVTKNKKHAFTITAQALNI